MINNKTDPAIRKYTTNPNIYFFLFTVNDAAWVSSSSTLHSSEFNLAAHAHIWTNATCGADGPETYCRLAQHVHQRLSEQIQCGVCDDQSADPDERHPIQNAIDGTNSWWQSPTMTHGKEYNWVTVTLDLKQVSVWSSLVEDSFSTIEFNDSFLNYRIQCFLPIFKNHICYFCHRV